MKNSYIYWNEAEAVKKNAELIEYSNYINIMSKLEKCHPCAVTAAEVYVVSGNIEHGAAINQA